MTEPSVHSWRTLECTQLTSRFLFPFVLGCDPTPADAVEGAAARLCRSRIAGTEAAWQRDSPPSMYGDELLPHVASYLFPAEDAPRRAVAYVRLSDVTANKIFHKLVATLRGKTRLPVALARPAGCEAFLTSNGTGVLSIALAVRDRISAQDAVELNYLGAARFASNALVLEVPHPSEDPKAWARILEAASKAKDPSRAVPKPAPADDAPAEARVGAAGGRFTLAELAAVLLAELQPLGLEFLVATPDAPSVPSVFTVGRFSADVDFADDTTRRRTAPLLAALTQVEEALHAECVPDHLGFPSALLNRKHWAGCSQVGTAHIVADQGPDETGKAPEFNNERVQRVLHKYFVPYLVALLQRLTLERILRDAGRIVASGDHPSAAGARPAPQSTAESLRSLRRTMLEFAVSGHFAQISTRHAVHLYFQLARAGLDIQQLWSEARQAITDLDAANAAEQQLRLADATNRNLESSLQTQRMMKTSLDTGISMQKALHVIEVFLVAVYSAHFMVMMIDSLHPHPWIEESAVLKHSLLLISPLAVAVAALAGWAWARRHTHDPAAAREIELRADSRVRPKEGAPT